MDYSIKSFVKTNEYLVCIDSDGCAIDSMTIKHNKAFGPAFIEVFGLDNYKVDLLLEWDRINLYSLTRGINRFKGLNMILHYCNDNYEVINDLEDFDRFCNTTKAFSNDALEEYKRNNPSHILDLCLEWSILTNKKIKEIPKVEIKPFEYVKESLIELSKIANIAVVSSANFDAIWDEWNRFDLIKYVDCFCSQNDGTKEICINKLLYKGFESKHVVMFGDGPGDLKAAIHNGIYFYPILCKKEKESWHDSLKYVEYISNNTFGEYQEDLVDNFKDNLKE